MEERCVECKQYVNIFHSGIVSVVGRCLRFNRIVAAGGFCVNPAIVNPPFSKEILAIFAQISRESSPVLPGDSTGLPSNRHGSGQD